MAVATDIVKNKDKVEECLQRYPNTRNCDKLLYMAVLEKEMVAALGAAGYHKLLDLLRRTDTPSMDTFGRIRRKFQEQGQYVGTNSKLRHQHQEQVKEAIRNFDNEEREALENL